MRRPVSAQTRREAERYVINNLAPRLHSAAVRLLNNYSNQDGYFWTPDMLADLMARISDIVTVLDELMEPLQVLYGNTSHFCVWASEVKENGELWLLRPAAYRNRTIGACAHDLEQLVNRSIGLAHHLQRRDESQ